MRVKIRKGHSALNSRVLAKMIKEELSKTLQEQSMDIPSIDMEDPEIQAHLDAFRAAGIDVVSDEEEIEGPMSMPGDEPIASFVDDREPMSMPNDAEAPMMSLPRD